MPWMNSANLAQRESTPNRGLWKWPNDARLAIALTFEQWSSASAKALQIVGTTVDYGMKRGVHNVLDILDRHDARSTFFFDGTTAEVYPSTIRAVSEAGHEVAAFGNVYEPHWDLSKVDEKDLVEQAFSAITTAAAREPSGWRTPLSRPSAHTLPLVARAGFTWDSSIPNDEMPYLMEFQSGEQLVEIPFATATDYRHYTGFPNPLVLTENIMSVWLDELDVLYRESEIRPSMLTFNCNASFTGRPGELSVLDQLLRTARALEGVWFATCGELASWTVRHPEWLEPPRDK